MPHWTEKVPDEVGEILIDERQIQKRVAELGGAITRDYQGKNPLLIAVLRGAAIFYADLIRHIDLKLRIDFISVSSYGAATRSCGEVQLLKDVESSIRAVDVILVEDIIDSGLTVDYLLRNLRNRGPASLRTCTFLSKPSRRQVQVQIDYVGFEVPDRFLVGYGLDHNQKYRNLPFIAVLDGV
ncbi:hypoxanthine phosphoribosyltransferase [Acidobacteria bacterium AH-259-O06]|nr:hypoxanthine phosphoribosyltransferase [Acidobacteria bacterium AH-259-O06]